MGFYELLQSGANRSTTENGAAGFFTSGKALLDINFAASSMRRMETDEIVSMLENALREDTELAMKWLFYLRDVRGGMGERDSFRKMLGHIGHKHPKLADALLDTYVEGVSMIPYYGRWDDLFALFDTHKSKVMKIVKRQLDKDLEAVRLNNRLDLEKSDGYRYSVSLLAKWLPSINTSNTESRKAARKIAKELGMSDKAYRKTLSALRKDIAVVEGIISDGRWEEVNYEHVPSKANILYANAFMRHDRIRRRGYLDALEKGEAKVNAKTAFPHDIVHALVCDRYNHENDSLHDAMWKKLIDGNVLEKNVIVVSDGSGSMTQRVQVDTSVTALDVASSLAIFFADQLEGPFAHKFITFSRNPQIVDLNGLDSLRDKYNEVRRHNEIEDTNIEAVFDLILQSAVGSHASQEELPDCILVISDMEFNVCACSNNASYGSLEPRLFDVIAERYVRAGYKMPRLAFWNVCSRTRTIPVIQNDLGVALISGFSPSAIQMAMSGEPDPYKCLVEVLNSERYAPVGESLKQVV